MNSKEKVELVEKVISIYRQAEEATTAIEKALGCEIDLLGGGSVGVLYKAIDLLIDNTALLIGDTDNRWLSWYIFDTGCGESDTGVEVQDVGTVNIKSPKDLIRFLEWHT